MEKIKQVKNITASVLSNLFSDCSERKMLPLAKPSATYIWPGSRKVLRTTDEANIRDECFPKPSRAAGVSSIMRFSDVRELFKMTSKSDFESVSSWTGDLATEEVAKLRHNGYSCVKM